MSKLEKVEKAIEKGKEAALIKLAQDKDEEVRLAAIAGMGKIGKDDSFNFIVPDMLTNDDPKVRATAAEALGNILDNAVKYTPEGGSVSVSVRPWQFYTRIDITDTGIGIPEEHYHDVFQRFYRGEEAAAMEGVGLGLYLANGIITRQKGYISVASKAGKGTTFSVYLLS